MCVCVFVSVSVCVHVTCAHLMRWSLGAASIDVGDKRDGATWDQRFRFVLAGDVFLDVWWCENFSIVPA